MSSSAPSPKPGTDDSDPGPSGGPSSLAVGRPGVPPPLTVVPGEATAPPLALPSEHPFLNGPVAGILLGNAITFGGAVFQHWPALPVLLIYWGQSVAIGVVNVIRLYRLKSFSTANFQSNGRPVPETPEAARGVARFFAMHYGMFHLVYLMFLLSRKVPGQLQGWTAVTVAGNVALFAGSHVWHLVSRGGQDYRRKPNLGWLVFYPYLRIIPMHFTIILGSLFPLGALPFFIVLKTAADLGMHAVEGAIFQTAED